VDDMSDQDKRHLWNGKEPSYYVTGHAPQAEPAQAEQPRNEPVGELIRGDGGAFSFSCGGHLLALYALPTGTHPLYTSPQAQPMSDEQIHREFNLSPLHRWNLEQTFAAGARYAERFHKIGG
jgi:hypothetical protein